MCARSYGDMMNKSNVDFLRWLKLDLPIKIAKILIDNGSQFTDLFSMKAKSLVARGVRQNMQCHGHRASLDSIASPTNEWHGGAVQRPY